MAEKKMKNKIYITGFLDGVEFCVDVFNGGSCKGCVGLEIGCHKDCKKLRDCIEREVKRRWGDE